MDRWESMSIKTTARRYIIEILLLMSKNFAYTQKIGLAKGLKRKGGLGFLPQKYLPTKEEKFLINLDLNGKTVYDVGAYKGLFTMFFARAVGESGRVIAFEPNDENFNDILQNIRLNNFGNVVVRKIALGRASGKVSLAFSPGVSREGSIQENIKAKILGKKGAKSIEVNIDSLDNQMIIQNLPKPDIVKIDVEGLELDVLEGMKQTIARYNPQLIIEIHGHDVQGKIDNIKKVVRVLIDFGYSIYHIESENRITLSNSEIAKEGHLYCKK